jgi:predicted anti-sigma-YlaC factor YlaD
MKNIICAKAKDLIVMDLDEGLDSSERQRLEGHLSECAHCKQWRD